MAAQDIIIRPVITEKTMDGNSMKKYTFEVSKVNTLHVRGQLRRQGRYQGYTRSWKKAVVTLTEDSKTIEFFESMV